MNGASMGSVLKPFRTSSKRPLSTVLNVLSKLDEATTVVMVCVIYMYIDENSANERQKTLKMDIIVNVDHLSPGVSQLNQPAARHGVRGVRSWLQPRSVSVILRAVGIHSW